MTEQTESNATSPTTESEQPIQVTPKAIEMGKKKLEEAAQDGIEGVHGIRVGIRGGGCNGYAYVFDFAKKIRPKRDMIFDFDGLKLVIDNRSVEYLRGSVLDWEEELLGYGFKWHNPNAKGACGCGESFTV
jgi:iron-sulfur cluster assembly protein